MAVPALIFLIIFAYWPTAGIVLAFKEYNYKDGIFGSPWVGLANFQEIFNNPNFLRALGNTLIISSMKLIIGFPFPIILALMLNETRVRWFKSTIQTLTVLPYFISWAVLGGLIINILSPSGGAVNEVLKVFGFEQVNFLVENSWFRPILVFTDIWKNAGWSAIIYMAALAGIDPQLYEAAYLDGASGFQRLLHITIPGITGAIATILILNMAWILNAGFEQVFMLYTPTVYETGDILETFLLRMALSEGKFEVATAVGLFQSIIGFVMLVTVNSVVKKTGHHGIY